MLNWAPHYSHQVHLTLATDEKVVQTCHDYRKKHAVYFSASFIPAAKPSFLTEWLPMYKVNAHVLTFKSERFNLPTQFQINPLPMIFFFVIFNKYIQDKV